MTIIVYTYLFTPKNVSKTVKTIDHKCTNLIYIQNCNRKGDESHLQLIRYFVEMKMKKQEILSKAC